MSIWPRSGVVQIINALSIAMLAGVIAFPATERYFIWYYTHHAGNSHDGQVGLSVLAGAVGVATAAFSGTFLLTMIIQRIKARQFSEKQ
jgi:hypothetical protein